MFHVGQFDELERRRSKSGFGEEVEEGEEGMEVNTCGLEEVEGKEACIEGVEPVEGVDQIVPI